MVQGTLEKLSKSTHQSSFEDGQKPEKSLSLVVDRTRIFWFGRTEPELKSPNVNRIRTVIFRNKIGTVTKVKPFFVSFKTEVFLTIPLVRERVRLMSKA